MSNDGGRIQWLRNPGNTDSSQPYWESHRIGNSTGMHRSIFAEIFDTSEYN